ncbi:MAG: hypothetical protein ACJAVK_001821 [Akkermansiaceae bacterium]|jgi:hypothetical protein
MINDQGTIAPVHADFLIGANPQTGASNREWNSFIDEVAQWDRVLDASEISPILSLRAIGPFPGRNGCLSGIPHHTGWNYFLSSSYLLSVI